MNPAWFGATNGQKETDHSTQERPDGPLDHHAQRRNHNAQSGDRPAPSTHELLARMIQEPARYEAVGVSFPDVDAAIGLEEGEWEIVGFVIVASEEVEDSLVRCKGGVFLLGYLFSTTCRRCNRKLTTPQSILSGIGPVCAGRG